jgi:secondary thiamine-phosphate synthase enzyme
MRLELRTTVREELCDVTARVRGAVRALGVENGTLVVSSPHTTAGFLVNENADPDVARDLLYGLAELAPRNGDWYHAEGNSDAHLKTALVGTSVMLPICEGEIVLGTWQAIYFAEFDGPRNRHFDVVVLPGRC